MRGQYWRCAGLWTLAAGALGPCAGCQTEVHNPWMFAEPPARTAGNEVARPGEPVRTVLAVTDFSNPEVPQLDWPHVGEGMGEALRRALRRDTKFKVQPGAEVDQVAYVTGANGTVTWTGDAPVGVDFVITGQVTDFHHTAELPKEISRWGFFRRRSEAVVALKWRVIDVRRRRVIAADHTYGTADASRKLSVEETYAGLDFSAYLFWNSPLGKAGHQAVDRVVKQMRKLLPAYVGDPVIVRRHGDRKVQVVGGWSWGLVEGQEYYVGIPEPGEAAPRPVYDPDTGRPLRLRIGRVSKNSSVAWLRGRTPRDVNLNGAVLSREPPPPGDDLANRQPLANLPAEE